MKKYFTFSFSILFLTAQSQNPSWIWAKNIEGTSPNDYPYSIAADNNGNSFISGSFSGTTITLGATTITNSGIDEDIFFAKYDVNGNVIWAKGAGGNKADEALSIATDIYDNCYVVGYFKSDTFNIGDTILYNVGLGYENVFIAKFDDNGNFKWAKSAGEQWPDMATSVCTDLNGNVYVSGNCFSNFSFGNTSLSSERLFLVKFDPQGNELWLKGVNGDGYCMIDTDQNGNIFMTGSYHTANLSIDTITLSNQGNQDIFIAKFDIDGNVIWVKNEGATSWDIANSIATDPFGNFYLAASYTVPNTIIDSVVLNNVGSWDLFLSKFDSDGNLLWIKNSGNTNADMARSISVDLNGNVILAGVFYSPSLTFESNIFTNFNSTNNSDIFLVKMDSNGNVVWTKSAGIEGDDLVFSCDVDSEDNLIIFGNFNSNQINFGSTTLLNTDGSIFLAKMENIETVETIEDKMFNLKIFPNPSSGKVVITSNLSFNILNIYSIDGKKIYSENGNSKSKEIDLSNFPNGSYLIQIYFESELVSRKWIKF